jgi:L-aspartate oxidase
VSGATHAFDVIVIGSGAAGLSGALTLAPHLRVRVLAKERLSSRHTPGRKAASPRAGAGDTFDSHIEDTMYRRRA